MIAFSLDLASPISSKKMTLITGVLQMIENIFMMTANALDYAPN
jgi:hypothetical protein